MSDKRGKTKSQSAAADTGPLFDKSLLASASVIMILLVLAMAISWLPQLFIRQESGGAIQADQAPAPTMQNQTAVQANKCKELLSNGSERYEFSYLINAASDSSGTMDSHLYASNDTASNSAWTRETVFDLDLSTLAAGMNSSDASAAMVPSRIKFVTYLNEEFRCISAVAVMTISGAEVAQPLSCDSSTIDNFEICKDNLTELSRTKLTVGAGTFDVVNYHSQADNSTISMADIPLPIEVTMGSTWIRLVSYRKVA
ncbi:Uncharacterised protein [uncultured archaeon]|nr:Uncharacterised protein [uncultured archaeon]